MVLPAEYVWLEPVLVAAVIVFIIDLIGNSITFSNRFANALATAIVFAVIFGALVYYAYARVAIEITTSPSAAAPSVQ